MIDFQSLPISGGFALGVIGYAAFSLAVAPVIATRTVEFSEWPRQCRAAIQSQIKLERPVEQSIPKMNCTNLFGIFGREMQDVCRKYGNPSFDFGILDQVNEQKRSLVEMEQRRLDARAAKAGSRCGCASSVVTGNRVPWALYTAGGRLMSVPLVENLQSELETALNSPRCARRG